MMHYVQGDTQFCLSLQTDSHFPPPAATSLDLLLPPPTERDPATSSKKKFRPPPLDKYDAGLFLLAISVLYKYSPFVLEKEGHNVSQLILQHVMA